MYIKKELKVLLAFSTAIPNYLLIPMSFLLTKTNQKKKEKITLQIEFPIIRHGGEKKLPTQKILLPLLSLYRLYKLNKNSYYLKDLFENNHKKVHFL